jgi:hypothetical protein
MLVVSYIEFFSLERRHGDNTKKLAMSKESISITILVVKLHLVNMHAITYRREYPTRGCHILNKKVFGHQKAESFSWYILDSR